MLELLSRVAHTLSPEKGTTCTPAGNTALKDGHGFKQRGTSKP